MKTASQNVRDVSVVRRAWRGLAAFVMLLWLWQASPLVAAEPEPEHRPAYQQPEGAPYNHTQALFQQPNERGEYSYKVTFDELSIFDEQRQRLRPAMSPAERRTARFNPFDPETVAYSEYLEARKSELIAMIETELGRQMFITTVLNVAIYAWLTPEEAELVAELPGVARVGRQSKPVLLNSNHSPSDVRARGHVWQPFPVGQGATGATGAKGLGTVIAIFDTGIDVLHFAFQNDPRCGHGSLATRTCCC